jgi:hypothetical protein
LEGSEKLVALKVKVDSLSNIPGIMLFPFSLPYLFIALAISRMVPAIDTT